MMDILQKPWPWYVAGPLIGLTVPLLLLLGNKTLGVSSSFRHVCAACFPAQLPFFTYDWKKEVWNLFFVAGIVLGAWITWYVFHHQAGPVDARLLKEMTPYGVRDEGKLVPDALISWPQLFSLRGIVMMVGGGFLIGFGTRYAGGCTSGHSIMGISNLQWPSLVATIFFLIGGLVMANLLLPYILKL